MKRLANNQEFLWGDPNELKIPELRQALSKFKTPFDPTEQRTRLFQRYVQLARVESPESVEWWIGQDTLNGPLPIVDSKLVMPKLKIYLALHAVDFPAQASRGQLVMLYDSLVRKVNQGAPARSATVRVVIPPHPEHKKRKPNSRASQPKLPSKPPAPPAPPLPRQEGRLSHIGKTWPTKSAARRGTFFLPYERRAPQEDDQTSTAGNTISRTTRSSTGHRGSSQTSRSSAGRGHSTSQPTSTARRGPSSRRIKPSAGSRTTLSHTTISSAGRGRSSSQPQSSARRGRSSSQITRPSAGRRASLSQTSDGHGAPSQTPSISSDGHSLRRSLRLMASQEPGIIRPSAGRRASLSQTSDGHGAPSQTPSISSDGHSLRRSLRLMASQEPGIIRPSTGRRASSSERAETSDGHGLCLSQTPSASFDGHSLRLSSQLSQEREQDSSASASTSQAPDGGSPQTILDETSELSTRGTDMPSSPNPRQSSVAENQIKTEISSQYSFQASISVQESSPAPTESSLGSTVQQRVTRAERFQSSTTACSSEDSLRSSPLHALQLQEHSLPNLPESPVVKSHIESDIASQASILSSPAPTESSSPSTVQRAEASKSPVTKRSPEDDLRSSPSQASEGSQPRESPVLIDSASRVAALSKVDTSSLGSPRSATYGQADQSPNKSVSTQSPDRDSSAQAPGGVHEPASDLSGIENSDDEDVPHWPISPRRMGPNPVTRQAASPPPPPTVLAKRRSQDTSELPDRSQISKRRRRSQSSPVTHHRRCPSIGRRLRKQNQPRRSVSHHDGFVYTRPVPTHTGDIARANPPTGPSSSVIPPPRRAIPPSIASSLGSSLSYAPSVLLSGLLPATSATTRSTRASTRAANARDFPTEHSRPKRQHLSKPDPQSQKQGRSRLKNPQAKKRHRRTRPSPAEVGDSFNFVPALPSSSKKRTAQRAQSSAHAKRPRSVASNSGVSTRSQASTTRRRRAPRQNSYKGPSLHDEVVLEPQESDHTSSPWGRRRSERIRSAGLSLDSVPPTRTGRAPNTVCPFEAPQPSTSELPTSRAPRRNQTGRRDSSAGSPYLHGDDQHERPESDGRPAKSSPRPLPHPSSVSSSAAPQRKRGHTDSSSSSLSAKPGPKRRRRGTPMVRRLSRIPTAAEVRRRRYKQNRVRLNSLSVRPSLHDDFYSPPPSACSVEGWVRSLPRNLPPPLDDHNCSAPRAGPSDSRPDPSNSGPCPSTSRPGPLAGGGWVGETVLVEMVRATDRLTDCLGGMDITALRQRTNQGQTSRSSTQRADLTCLARVRQHIKTLFGKCMTLHQFPPPATEQEKAKWKFNLETDDDESISSRSSSLDEDVDPAFPYPDGPGHQEASPATLSIMWRAMRHAGVVSFRPDFTLAPRNPNNLFLWDLAHRIFIRLVQAGEYSEIDLASCPEDMIRQAILNHAKQLKRIHHEAGWDPERLDQRAVTKRRQARTRNLRDCRTKFLTSQAGLIPFIPVINDCTSEAETDVEDNDSDIGPSKKQVLVQQLPWRHPRIGRAVKLIDQLIDLKRQSGCKDYGKLTIQRVRPHDPKISSRACPKSLSCDVYCDEWLKSQRPSQLNALNIQPGPSYKGLIKQLERMI